MNNNPSDLPPIPGAEAFVHNVDTAAAYWWQDILWIILANGEETGGRFSLMEELLPKDSGPPPHKHTWSDETFYLLAGEITFLIGEEIKTARGGDLVLVPRNTRHAFRVDSGTARFLNGYTPASLEAAVVELAMPARERAIPPKGLMPPSMMTPEQFHRYGMDFLPGPDPLRPEKP